MDLSRMSSSERLKLCKRYFYIGFACLPWLWLVNSIWFGHFVFIQAKKIEKKNRGSRTRATAAPGGEQQLGRSLESPSLRESNGNASPKAQQSDVTRRKQMVAQLDKAQGSGNITTTTTPTRANVRESIGDPDAGVNQEDANKMESLRQLRRYVILSFIGAMVWLVVLIAWIVVYQINRVKWGEWGDSISFNIPRGIP